jgi:hypothetical protein
MMETNCPPAIDWMGYLAGNQPPTKEEHLEACPSCRAVIEGLKHQGAEQIRFGNWMSRIDIHSYRPWTETKPGEPTVGQIWFSAPSFSSHGYSYKNVDRIPLLILEQADFQLGNLSWFNVAPVWTDIENASQTDLVLETEDTDLGGSLRVLFHLQTVVTHEQLDFCVGGLSMSGTDLLTDILAGHFPTGRFGAPFDNETDPRVVSADWIEEIVKVIGSFCGHVSELDGHSQDFEHAADPAPARTVPLRLFKTEFGGGGRGLPWAASSTLRGTQLSAVADGKGFSLRGWFRHRLFMDRVVFIVERTKGLDSPIRISIYASAEAEPIVSDEFSPTPGHEVVIAEGRGVLLADVTQANVLLG